MQCTIMGQHVLLILLLMPLWIKRAQAQAWVLEKSQQNVNVYIRDASDNSQQSALKEVMAKTTVEASPHALLRLLDDVSRAPEWIDNCLSVKILEGESANTKIVQSTFSAPWPLRNRDMVTESTTIEQPDQLRIVLKDVGENYPTQKGLVRMTLVSGEWRVKSVAPGTVEISYQGVGNPSGNVPVWLANKVIVDSTFATFVQLSQIITEQKYQQK